MPDDILIYAFLTDAHVELGNYGKAEQAAQWMLDLRPGNVTGMTRGAYLREIFGDVVGAIEWIWAAYEQTPFHEIEDHAWVLAELAHLKLSRGELVFYYTYILGEPEKEVAVARQDIERRRDVFTLDAYAWHSTRAESTMRRGSRSNGRSSRESAKLACSTTLDGSQLLAAMRPKLSDCSASRWRQTRTRTSPTTRARR